MSTLGFIGYILNETWIGYLFKTALALAGAMTVVGKVTHKMAEKKRSEELEHIERNYF